MTVDLETLEPATRLVCVEIREGAEDLRDVLHPEDALYVFGDRLAKQTGPWLS